MADADYQVTSAEDANGRILSGVGASVEDLEKTMERHAPDVPAAPSEPVAPETPAEPKQTRGQKRFSELTSERDKERQAREAAERERDELRQQLARQANQPAPVPSVQRTESEPPKATEKPQKFPYTFDTWQAAHPQDDYDDFVTAKALWTFQQQNDLDARIRRTIDADRSQRELTTTIQSMLTKGKELHADFDTVRTTGPGSQVTIPGPKLEAILKSPDAAHYIYEIAKDGALAQQLASASDIEFGMLLAGISPKPANGAPLASPSPVVPPPAPYQPVGGGSKSTALPLEDLVKRGGHDFDKSGYREKRAAELGRGRRR